MSPGLRGLGSKRTRSPAHALEREDVVDTVRARVDLDPACQVLDEENDNTSELPWRTPSPAVSNNRLSEGWKEWNSAEPVPLLDFLDSNHDITAKTKRSDFLGTGNDLSIPEQDATDASEEEFMFPGSGDPAAEGAGRKEKDASATSNLHTTDRLPVGVDRDSRDFVKRSAERIRAGRSTEVKRLLATAQMARATRLAQTAPASSRDASAPREQSQDDSETARSANEETDGQVPELSPLSKRGVIVRGMPQKARRDDVYAALSAYGELETVLMNYAGSFAHVIFASEDACKAALRSKHVKVLDEEVELVRGPNSLGPVSKRGLDRPGPAFVAASLRPDDAQEDGFVGTRVVGKVDDLTFGTGLRRAKYWVQRDYVAGNATSHGEGDGWAKELQVDEHCVAVYNLPPGANETWIRALFSRCGTVKQVSIEDIVAGQSRYAVVEYTHKDAADEAIARIDGQSRAGHMLRVKARGDTRDGYQLLVEDQSNPAAIYGASNSQPGHKH